MVFSSRMIAGLILWELEADRNSWGGREKCSMFNSQFSSDENPLTRPSATLSQGRGPKFIKLTPNTQQTSTTGGMLSPVVLVRWVLGVSLMNLANSESSRMRIEN